MCIVYRTTFFFIAVLAAAFAALAFSSVPDLSAFEIPALAQVDFGQIQSLAFRVIGAGIVFGAIVYFVRLLQSFLRRSVLTPERIDHGIAYAIEKAIGYAGLVLAILYAASIVGLDLSGLTIVAGALSVGVGFGLQTIISNFVSGIILLIERPVRIGDWVVVKDKEGVVRRINVRSTEIETFEGATVLIPNSEFITGVVQNWMLGSPGGRTKVEIRTGPDADPEAVLDILRRAAAAHPAIDQTKPASASFVGFDAGVLTFELNVPVGEIGRGGSVRSDLRIMVLRAFRDARIGLPGAPAPGPAPVAAVGRIATARPAE
jgi:potassium-dependent mechanosensitive channel